MITELRRRLYHSVSRRTQGDVPVGVYLSGGLDSSIIAGMLADFMGSPRHEGGSYQPDTNARITAYSVGFEEGTAFDEMRMLAYTRNHLELHD